MFPTKEKLRNLSEILHILLSWIDLSSIFQSPAKLLKRKNKKQLNSSLHNFLPSTWCGFSLVTICLLTCTNGSLVSSSSSKTSLVVIGHFRGEASSISITWKQKKAYFIIGIHCPWLIWVLLEKDKFRVARPLFAKLKKIFFFFKSNAFIFSPC